MEHQLARGRAGVDPLFQADERDAALLQHRHRREQLGQRPTQAVEPDNGERVAAACLVEERSQPRLVKGAAGADAGEHLGRAGSLQPHP